MREGGLKVPTLEGKNVIKEETSKSQTIKSPWENFNQNVREGEGVHDKKKGQLSQGKSERVPGKRERKRFNN